MIFPGVKKIGRSLNIERTNNKALGKVGNTFIRLYDGNNMKVLEMTFPQITDNDKEIIDQIFRENKIKNVEWIETKVVVIFREIFWPYSTYKIKSIIDRLCQYATATYKDHDVTCEECKTNETAEAFEVSDGSIFLCSSCYIKLQEQLTHEKEEYQRIPGNYYFGSIGAFLFSIPGIVLTAVFFIFLDKIAAASSVLYIFLAIKGYTFFKGKLDRMGALLINVIGVTMTCIGIYSSYALMILYKTKSMQQTKEIIKMPDVIKEIKLNIIIALIISSFYMIFNTYEMFKKWKFPELKRAKKIV
jgi:hypothetical protein